MEPSFIWLSNILNGVSVLSRKYKTWKTWGRFSSWLFGRWRYQPTWLLDLFQRQCLVSGTVICLTTSEIQRRLLNILNVTVGYLKISMFAVFEPRRYSALETFSDSVHAIAYKYIVIQEYGCRVRSQSALRVWVDDDTWGYFISASGTVNEDRSVDWSAADLNCDPAHVILWFCFYWYCVCFFPFLLFMCLSCTSCTTWIIIIVRHYLL